MTGLCSPRPITQGLPAGPAWWLQIWTHTMGLEGLTQTATRLLTKCSCPPGQCCDSALQATVLWLDPSLQ